MADRSRTKRVPVAERYLWNQELSAECDATSSVQSQQQHDIGLHVLVTLSYEGARKHLLPANCLLQVQKIIFVDHLQSGVLLH